MLVFRQLRGLAIPRFDGRSSTSTNPARMEARTIRVSDPRCMEMDHALIIALRFNGSESIGASVNLEGWSAAGLDPVLHKVACDWLSPNRQLRCNSPRETGDASPDSCPAYLPSRAVPVRIRRPILGAFTRFVG